MTPALRVLDLDSLLRIRIKAHVFLLEIHKWAPIWEMLMPVKTVIELLNRGIDVELWEPEFTEPLFMLVEAHNANYAQLVKTLPPNVDPNDYMEGKPADQAEDVLARKLNKVVQDRNSSSGDVYRRAAAARAKRAPVAVQPKRKTQGQEAEITFTTGQRRDTGPKQFQEQQAPDFETSIAQAHSFMRPLSSLPPIQQSIPKNYAPGITPTEFQEPILFDPDEPEEFV